jgi:hypothetical protein
MVSSIHTRSDIAFDADLRRARVLQHVALLAYFVEVPALSRSG